MRGPFFVEVLHRNREVRHRQQLHALPIRIGRGYDNDIILDDPHTSAHHALIDQTADGLLLQDLDSRNGIIHKGRRQKELLLDGNTVFRLGHTNLRVRCADFPVAEEIAASTNYNWEGWPPAAAGIALIIGLTVINTWLGDTDKFELIHYLLAIVTALGLGMVWCGIWSLANRLFGGNTRLGRHLFILGCGIAALQLWSLLSATIAFGLSWELFTRFGSHVVIAIMAVMIFYHLLHIKPYRSRLFAMTSVALALFGSGLALMINYNSNGRLADELFMHERLPLAMRLSADKPLSRLLSDAARLKTGVDAERSRELNGDEANSSDEE